MTRQPEHHYVIINGTGVPYNAGSVTLPTNIDIPCGEMWPVLHTSVTSGTERWYGRDGSHHTTKDSTGWRPPTPYWGYDFYRWRSVPLGFTPIQWASNARKLSGNNANLTVKRDLPMTVEALKAYRPNFPDLEAQAITAALAKAGSATAELGVELIEARKTAGLVEDTLKSLVSGISAIRKGRAPKGWGKPRDWFGPKAPTAVANKWLEYRYGWTPLVLGIYDACELLERKKDRLRLKATEIRSDQSLLVKTVDSEYWHGGFYPIAVVRTTVTGEVRYVKAVLYLEARYELATTLNEAGVTNPASVYWETVPFSFVVDWFWDVGGYFNAQQALRLFRLKGGTATHVHEWPGERTIVSRDTPTVTQCLPFECAVKGGGKSFNRVVLDTSDMNPIVNPDTGLDFLRSADLAALAWGMLKGMFTKGSRARV